MTDEKRNMEMPSDHSRFMPLGQGKSDTPRFFPDESETATEDSADDMSVSSEATEIPVKEEVADEVAESADKENPGDRSVWAILSHLISWVMVPMLMPVYGIILIFSLSILNFTSAGTRFWFAAIVFGINVVLPALIIILLKRLGLVDDLGLNGRKERLIPYIVSIAALCITAWFMAQKQAPAWVWLFFLGGAAGGVGNLIINFKWKISAHAAGVAGIVALLIRIARDGFPQGNVMLWLLIWILLAGLTGSARLYLHRHTFWQVMAGYATGFISVYLITSL